MVDSTRTGVIVLAGGTTARAGRGVGRVICRIAAEEAATAVLRYSLERIGDGVVVRRLRLDDADSTTALELVRGCLSCTVRDDLLSTLCELASRPALRRTVLVLDPVMEPGPVCNMILEGVVDGARVTDLVDLRGVISVLDVGCWLPDAGGAEPLRERGLPGPAGDKRTVAQLGIAHAECADLLVYAGAAEQWLQARTSAVLARLNPLAARISTADLDSRVLLDALPTGARRGRRESRHAPLLRGQPPLAPCAGVQLMMFTARRPFHPERLHRAIGALLDGGVVRTRGRIWLAPRPDSVFWLQSAGGSLGISQVGDWLAAGDARAWQAADPERHAQAALRWHHRWGDRAQDLAILVHEGDPTRIETTLREALLTDDELATGEHSWRDYPDPFGLWHTDPCEDTTTQPAHRPRGHRPNGDDHP